MLGGTSVRHRLCTLRTRQSVANGNHRNTGRRRNLVVRLALILIASLGLGARDVQVIKPFLLELERPQVIRPGAWFPYLWLLRDGAALLEVSKGKRIYRRPGGF